MAKKRSSKRSEEQLQGPPPREATLMRGDTERQAEKELTEHGRAESPELAGGDLDADWQRASSDGEEAVGGTVATPDQDVVDDLGKALGVPHAPDEELRASSEILDRRDQKRWEQEP
jgi:hypothetical protein